MLIAAGVIALTALPNLRADVATGLGALFESARVTHLGLPAAILVFVLTAYVGAPQALLIGACVLAFGPTDGFWYSWIATIISGAATFQSGRVFRFSARGPQPPTRLSRALGRKPFLASLLARFVPGPPFVVVNAALAAANARFWPYLAGLAIGVLPKTAVIAFAGGSVGHVLNGNLGLAAALLGGACLTILMVMALRTFARSRLDQTVAD